MALELRKAHRALQAATRDDSDSAADDVDVLWYDEPCENIVPVALIKNGDVRSYFHRLLDTPVAVLSLRLLEASDQCMLDVVWNAANIQVVRNAGPIAPETKLAPLRQSFVLVDASLTSEYRAMQYPCLPPTMAWQRQASASCSAWLTSSA